MIQILEQTHEERVEMYMKLTKKELVSMLIECNKIIDLLKFRELPFVPINTGETEDNYCLHDNCPGCKNGTCDGVHMISCPCPKCSPRC